jgi:GNAT superfamily N-acetyltransferase
MSQIVYLVDHAEVIPTLVEWFQSEWPVYYAQRTLVDIAQDFYADLNRNELPIRLVAFLAGELVGTIVLREKVLETHPEYCPGLGGLYVAKPHRRCGIGTELVQAGMSLAQRIGYQVIYTTTNVAQGIVEHLQWEQIGSVLHHGDEIALYRFSPKDKSE